MARKKSIGLPGGPNEYLQDITQYISVDGYKRTSSDKTNPVNIIESGSITMEDVDFPVMGTDNLGNSQMMFPENEYQFPGDMVMEVPQAQLGAMGKVAKPFIKKGVKYLKSFFDDAVSVTDDVVEEVVKKNPIAESVANTPKKLNRPPVEDYVFYRNTSNPESIMKSLDFENPRVYSNWKAPENLSFFTPSNSAFKDYGAQQWGAKINPKKPYYEYSPKTYDVDEIKKLMGQGYDAIITTYDKADIRDAYQVVTLDKSIITDLQRYKELGGESLPVAQFGALGRMVKPYAKKGIKYLKDFLQTKDADAIYRGVYLNDEIRNLEKFLGKTDDEILEIMGTQIPGSTGTFRKRQWNQTMNFGRDFDMAADHVRKFTNPNSIYTLGNTDDFINGQKYVLKVKPNPALRNMSAEQNRKLYEEVLNNTGSKDFSYKTFYDAGNARGFGPDLPIRTEGINVLDGNFPQFIGQEGDVMGKLIKAIPIKQKAGEIRQYNPPGFFENLADILASPMTSFGYSARNQNIPKGLNVNNPERNAFDSVIDMINPFAWKQYAENASDNVEKGEYLDASFDALGAIPIVPAWMSKGKNFKGPIKETIKKVKEVIKPTDDMVEVFTSDGSKKLMKKTDAVRLNRIEDANVNNKTFTNYEDGNWFSDEIQPFYLNNAKNTLKGGLLNPADPKRVMSAYLDPADAKLFDVSSQGTSVARNMSGGVGNLPIKGEYVLPPALVKIMREGTSGPGYNTMIGNSESIMKNLDSFYKKLGGGVYQEGGDVRVPKRKGVRLNYDAEGNVISESTHLMKAEQLEDGTWVGFPSLFQNEDGKWIDMSGEKDWMNIYNEALNRGEVIEFGDDSESAIKFGEGSWKPKMKLGGGLLPKAQTGNRGNNTLDKAVIPVLEGAAEKADEFSTWLGKQTKDLMSPDLDIETRLKMFEQVRPVSYPGFGSIVNEGFGLIGDALGLTDPESPSLDKDGDLDFSEEAWARALKIPTKDKYIKQQTEYKPTTAKDSDVQYYKISDEIFDKESFLLDFQDMAIGEKQTVDGLLPYMKEAYFEATGQSDSTFMDTDPLQNFQVQVGYDKERDQKYLSMYDKYDFNSIANAGIKPYEFYDRIYIPKDSDKKEKTKNKVDSNILYKQAFVESNLDPKAKSNKGYMGLGQIGDSLITDYKKANKVDEIDPYDPEQNYKVQEWSMNELYNSSFINKENQDDDVRLIKTLAAYNWGRGNTLDLLNKLKEEGEDIYNDVKWVSRLPQETQDYIDMILYDKNTEGRPNVQENFLKTTTDEAYDYYKQLYNYKDINDQDSLPVKQYAGPIRQEEEQSFYLPEMWQQDNYVQEPPIPYMGPFRQAEEKPKQEEDNLTSYTIKSGDNLTRIAEQFGTSVDEIAKLNNIDNPSQIYINQELKLPKSKTKFLNYDIKSGDTLGRIATRFGVPVRKIVEANSSIKNINEIFAGQDIVIPQSNYEEVEEIEETWQDVDLLDEDRKNINDSADEDIIKKSQMVNDPNGHYVIVNKKTKRLEVWRGGKSILDFEVLTGANEGDALTVTKMWDFNQDGKITDEDKRNGKWIPNWSAGNKNTGAGKYYIKESYADSPDKYGGKGVPSFNLFTDGTDIDVATAIHGPTSGRKGLFNDGNVENNRASNGCINGQCTDLQALYDLGMPAGTAVYVLPEDDGNNFQWVDGQAVLKMSEDNREKYTSNYIDSKGREQTQQGSNYSVNTLNYQPIRPVFDQQAFEEEVYNETGTLKSIGDFFTSDSSDKEEQENSTKPFIDALVDNKKKIMVEAGIPSDVYNDIARIAFGIYGNESNFGDTHSAGGNFTRGVTKFVADQNRKGELPIVGSTDLLPKVTSSPDVFKKYNGYTINTLDGLASLSPLIALAVKDSLKADLPVYEKNSKEDYNSVGLTQLRWDNIIKEDKNLPEDKKQINILKKFGITSNKDLLDPEKAAIATVLRLAFLANNRKGVDRNDLFNTLPKHWGGSSKDDGKTYTENVKKHAKYLKFQQKGKYMPNYAVGGEKKQIQMYKDYIDGVYDGTDNESKAKSLYDKLNRKHYKDAKELGNMSPPNYILTHLYQA